MSEPVTIRQVAAAAGVSPATVSRVLAGSPRVDAGLAARTLAAVDELGYRANRVAQALRTRSTGTVGMVVPNIANPFFPIVIQAVEKELRQHGARLLLCDSGDDVAEEAELISSLLDHRIDGILLSPCDRRASQDALRRAAAQVPVVQVDRFALKDLDYVGVHQEDAMGLVVAHLIEQGCRTFTYVTSNLAASTAAERHRAYVRAVRDIDSYSERRVHEGDHSLAWGQEAARQILEEGDLPDAIVCASDLVAVGVLDRLRGLGIDVPNDVLVTGFDATVLARVAWPSLTSVRQPLEEIGKLAVQVVLETERSSRVGRTWLLPAELIIGDSTKKIHELPSQARSKTTGRKSIRQAVPKS